MTCGWLTVVSPTDTPREGGKPVEKFTLWESSAEVDCPWWDADWRWLNPEYPSAFLQSVADRHVDIKE